MLDKSWIIRATCFIFYLFYKVMLNNNWYLNTSVSNMLQCRIICKEITTTKQKIKVNFTASTFFKNNFNRFDTTHCFQAILMAPRSRYYISASCHVKLLMNFVLEMLSRFSRNVKLLQIHFFFVTHGSPITYDGVWRVLLLLQSEFVV